MKIKSENNPMQSILPMHLSKRCGAKTRERNVCQAPAMINGRCRMHGGKSKGAPKNNKNALKTGLYTADMKLFKKRMNDLLQEEKYFMSIIEKI